MVAIAHMKKPLYRVLFDHILDKIERKEYLPHDQLPTEAQLAQLFEVSLITSKRAFAELERAGHIYRIRGSGSYVKPSEPSDTEGSGQSKDHRFDKVISMVIPFENASVLFGYIRGATDYLHGRGYFLSLHQTKENFDHERKFLLTLPKDIPGIILYPMGTNRNMEVIHTLYMNKYPIVTIDKVFESIPVSSVVSDNAGGGYQAASKLIALGHRRIGFLSSVTIESASSIKDRYFGYCRALQDHGLPIDSEIVSLDLFERRKDLDKRGIYQTVIEHLLSQGVTAVQCGNDLNAIELYKHLAEKGVSIPEDLSIIGFDNNEILNQFDIPLTTIEQNFYEIGRKAAELVIGSLDRGSIVQENIRIPVKMVDRGSVGPAPSRGR